MPSAFDGSLLSAEEAADDVSDAVPDESSGWLSGISSPVSTSPCILTSDLPYKPVKNALISVSFSLKGNVSEYQPFIPSKYLPETNAVKVNFGNFASSRFSLSEYFGRSGIMSDKIKQEKSKTKKKRTNHMLIILNFRIFTGGRRTS